MNHKKELLWSLWVAAKKGHSSPSRSLIHGMEVTWVQPSGGLVDSWTLNRKGPYPGVLNTPYPARTHTFRLLGPKTL